MSRRGGAARAALRILAAVVPADRRAEWLEEWEGELDALESLREEGRARDYPGVAAFVAGALPHALWIRTEGWTMESVAQDLRFAGRLLRRSPVFTLVAALTLALGIGANGAMLSLVNGLLLRPPAGVAEPERLVQIARSYDESPRWDNWSWPASRVIADETAVFAGVAGYAATSLVLGRGTEAEAVPGLFVSGSYFRVLGVRPWMGRLLDASDEVAPGAHAVAVLGHGLWTRRFGADPGVIGTTIAIGSRPYEVVGVAPAGFTGVEALGTPPDLFVPAFQYTLPVLPGSPFESWELSWFQLFGRLQDGVSFPTAEAAMDPLTARLRSARADLEGVRVVLARGVGLTPEERTEAGRISALLVGIAVLLLLLTCANVGNLFLARATDRGQEVGIRQALGAGRTRMARQLVTESVVLALFATLLAVPLLASAGVLLPGLLPQRVAVSLTPDWPVFAAMAAAGVLAGLLFGALPAWAASRQDVARTLREGGATRGRGRTRLRDALVVSQLALSLGLVSGAALLGRSILHARAADPGFDADGLVVGFVNLRASGRYETDEAEAAFRERLLAEVAGIPGVLSAALAGQAPVVGGHARSSVVPAERAEDPEASVEAEYVPVTAGYFETLGLGIARGRGFRPAAEEPERVVVVNEALAGLFWPGEDAVGKELGGGQRIIGVVPDVQMRSLRAPANPAVYYLMDQEERLMNPVLHVRVGGNATAAVAAVRRAMVAVDPELPVTNVLPLREGLARSLAETRTFARVVTTFAGLALLLSLIGLYGLVSHGVAQRTREMGIRIALGAASADVTRVVLGRAMALAAVGVVLGIGVSLLTGRALEGALFGVEPTNPLALGGAAALLACASLIAAWVPARRAGRVDAMVSLRD